MIKHHRRPILSEVTCVVLSTALYPGVATEGHASAAVTGKEIGEVLCQPVENHALASRGKMLMNAEKRVKSSVLWVSSRFVPGLNRCKRGTVKRRLSYIGVHQYIRIQ